MVYLGETKRETGRQGRTTPSFFLPPLLILLDLLEELLRPALRLPPRLPPLNPPRDDRLRLVVRKQVLEYDIGDPRESKVEGHDGAETRAEGPLHRDELQPAVELGDEIGRAGEGDGGDTEETVVEGRVFGDTLAEGTALEVDGEGRDLLCEEGRMKVSVEGGREREKRDERESEMR